MQPLNDLKGPVIVTGASGGIGEQLARQLAEQGAGLILVARNEPALTRLRDELTRAHPRVTVHVFVADLSRPGEGAKLAAFATENGLTVGGLVNNAGVGSHELFVEEDSDALARQIQLNCATLVELTRQFLPGMIAARSGFVINVASTAAFQPVPTMAVYGATKAFVLSFTEALWVETRGSGVRVLTLCPGATDTGFFDATGKEFLTRGRETPEQVAATALAALGGRGPTVVSGRLNQLSATGYRFVPRGLLARISGRFVAT